MYKIFGESVWYRYFVIEPIEIQTKQRNKKPFHGLSHHPKAL
jgi:hypothetical protein